MKFVFDNHDIEFVKADVPKSEVTLEIIKTGKNCYTILYRLGDGVAENGEFNKEELKTLWKMLSEK